MRLSDVLTLTRARFVSANGSPNLEVRAGFAADLMSDALRYDLSGALLVAAWPRLRWSAPPRWRMWRPS